MGTHAGEQPRSLPSPGSPATSAGVWGSSAWSMVRRAMGAQQGRREGILAICRGSGHREGVRDWGTGWAEGLGMKPRGEAKPFPLTLLQEEEGTVQRL